MKEVHAELRNRLQMIRIGLSLEVLCEYGRVTYLGKPGQVPQEDAYTLIWGRNEQESMGYLRNLEPVVVRKDFIF